MVRNGSHGESKTSTLDNNNNNKQSDDDRLYYPDDKFEEFISRVRDETRRRGAITNPTTTATANTNSRTTTPPRTNKSAVTGLPLTSAWRSAPNNHPNNNTARSGQSQIGKPMSGDTAIEFLLKEATYNKKPNFNNNGKEKEKFSREKKADNIIDSREAGKRYGKILSRTRDDEEEEYELYYQGAIITSREALVKYNGAFVP